MVIFRDFQAKNPLFLLDDVGYFIGFLKNEILKAVIFSILKNTHSRYQSLNKISFGLSKNNPGEGIYENCNQITWKNKLLNLDSSINSLRNAE